MIDPLTHLGYSLEVAGVLLRATVAAVLLLVVSPSAHAQTYRCKDDAGLAVLQQIPCPSKQGRAERDDAIQGAISRRCDALRRNQFEYFRCGAEIVCEMSGAAGDTRTQCVRQLRTAFLEQAEEASSVAAQRQEEAAAALADRRAREDREAQLRESPERVDVFIRPDCLDVQVLLSKMGVPLYDRMAHVSGLEQAGSCSK